MPVADRQPPIMTTGRQPYVLTRMLLMGPGEQRGDVSLRMPGVYGEGERDDVTGLLLHAGGSSASIDRSSEAPSVLLTRHSRRLVSN